MHSSDRNQQLNMLKNELALGLEQAERGELFELDLDAIEAEAIVELEAGNLDVKSSVTH
jgi:hypothetical protein